MVNHAQLTPSQKIKALRESANCMQQDLAVVLGCTKFKISKVENGVFEYNKEDIAAAKKFFGVEKAPFTDKELMEFKQQLYNWKNLIRNGPTNEARKIQNDLAIITQLPFEPDLNTLYRMFEIRLVLAEENIALAEKMLLSEASLIEEATEENKHYFYHNMGSLYYYKVDIKTALQYYLKARSFETYVFKKDDSLNINMAFCYTGLGKYTLAIGTIVEVYDLIELNKSSVMRTYIQNTLAINYVNVGQVTRAKRILDKALSEAMGIDGKLHIGFILHNYGCACLKSKEYQEAIDYFNRTNEYVEIGDKFYIENMYWKIYCLIELKEVANAKVLLSEMKPLIEGSEHYSLNFESLSHLLTINDDASLEFIEKKTIPYLIEKYEYFRALDYCYMLVNKFTKRINKGYKKRLVKLKEVILKITEEMLFGEEVISNEDGAYEHYPSYGKKKTTG